MKIYIMSDLEGPAGVMDRANYVFLESKYYETAKRLLTLEVNAAIEGFFEAGATEIMVADGHGSGGIEIELLDERVTLQRGFPDPYPFGLDDSFDAIAWIGQHAKACTPYSFLCHTGSHTVLDQTLNGVSIGEFGQLSSCASELKVLPIFGSGDEAFCREAEALAHGIETVSVKRGLRPDNGENLTFEEQIGHYTAAVHLNPIEARRRIKAGAYKAAMRFKIDPKSFKGFVPTAPYELITKYRAAEGRHPFTARKHDDKSIIGMFNSTEERI